MVIMRDLEMLTLVSSANFIGGAYVIVDVCICRKWDFSKPYRLLSVIHIRRKSMAGWKWQG